MNPPDPNNPPPHGAEPGLHAPDPAAPTAPLWREFLSSPHHAWTALFTLGASFALAQPLFLVAGATAYALAWIYLPDSGLFRRWVNLRRAAQFAQDEPKRLEAFRDKRRIMLNSLSPPLRRRYDALIAILQEIATQSQRNAWPDQDHDANQRKLEELAWTFLRLLAFEERAGQMLAVEESDDLESLLRAAEAEWAELSHQSDEPGASPAMIEARVRLLRAKRERLETLRQREQQLIQTRLNLELARAELNRIEDEVKLVRSQGLSTMAPDEVSSKIDGCVAHLTRSHDWARSLETLGPTDDLPPTQRSVGYE